MSFKSGVKGRGTDRWWEQRWWLWWITNQPQFINLSSVSSIVLRGNVSERPNWRWVLTLEPCSKLTATDWWGFVTFVNKQTCYAMSSLSIIMRNEVLQLFVQEQLVQTHHGILGKCSTDLCSAIPECCCSCFRQRRLVAYPGDCLLSTGCRTDRRHDWQTSTADFRNSERPPLSKS